ncbi:MAG: Ppx/GppA family phosphatase, partial [Sulfurovum sp.]
FEKYKTLLPPKETLLWLGFIYSLTIILYETSHEADIQFTYENQTLTIYSNKALYLAKEKIKSLKKPIAFAIIIKDEEKIPKNKKLGIV